MQRAEVQAAGALAGEAIGGFGSLVGGMHEAIAGRVFRALGPIGLPVQVVHDRVSDGAYLATRAGLAALPRGGAALAAARAPEDGPSLASTARGGAALSALNAAVGDRLLERADPLALTMAVRRRGGVVALTPDALAAAFPEAGPRVAVFLHGLGENEHWWRRRDRPSYGARLRSDLGYTAVYVRYNTGRHISDNGRELAELLDELVAAWPVEVSELALVGHSMGGLVARSASYLAECRDRAWIEPLRHVVCLGSPHLGAPLEKAANVAGWTLARLPETRPFAKVVNGRSVGIKDLRFGSCDEADWCDCDADELLTDRCIEVPFVDHATYCFVAATLEGPLGPAVGDLLVRLPSASGRGRRRTIPFRDGRRLSGLTHFDLLNHPDVYAALREWLGAQPAVAE